MSACKVRKIANKNVISRDNLEKMKKNDNDSNSYSGDKYTKNDTIFPVK